MSKMSAGLPKGDENGLGVIARQLIEDPHRVHAVICLIDCKRTTTDNDTGSTEPTARIRRIEVVPVDQLDVAERMIRRALETRTGATTLDIELEDEDEITAIFQSLRINPSTGEIPDNDGASGWPGPIGTNDDGEDN